jgi:hypothetical protein
LYIAGIKQVFMKSYISVPVSFFMAATLLLGCGGGNSQTAGKEEAAALQFPQVQVPSYINDRQQAVNYMAANFWDKFFALPAPENADTRGNISSTGADRSTKNGKKLSGRSAVHGVDSLSFEEAFGMYAQLLTMSAPHTVEKSVKELFANLESLALAGERKPLLEVMKRAEHYFYDPNSPVLDEEVYLHCLSGILAARSLQELDKMQYEYQYRICSLNRVGTPAADFSFRQLVAGNHLPDSSPQMYSPTPPKGYVDKTLYKNVKGEYTLLFFNNPDCGACGEILDAIKNSHLAELVHQKKLAVVAMYTDEDLSAWARNREKYPKEWIYAFDHKLVLRDNNIYGLRAIPSLYLLDKDKRVILKDATVDVVINALR